MVGYPIGLPNRNSTGILKKTTVIGRAWETGRSMTFKIKEINQELAMSSRRESARARERLQLETPICDDASLVKLEEDAAEYLREAKRCDASGPEELISAVVEKVARKYFRHVLQKQARMK